MIMAFVNMGLCGDNESIYTLMRLVGPDKAELMMMTGDAYKGEQCVKTGLATVLAEDGKLAETTYAPVSYTHLSCPYERPFPTVPSLSSHK